ncbi:hypothetical protein H6F74_24905 [Trichocoleus sp. FACHB-90]|uniref:hypothetical protein n=1 Tax=Cyanophyceae TaxID=3028117 RepID=UPI00168A01C5|nr:hypothetical protein [Trichocoleus sp. FACHB-90]MBD1929456.1 hypothetical protein [Trichocoleus sp. FACHB-90]
MEPIYIANHILRIEGEHQEHPSHIADSLWRIADHANLFSPTPDNLAPSQQQQVREFINEFRTTPQGQTALAQVKPSLTGGYRRW